MRGAIMAARGNDDDVLEDFFASLDIADDSVEGGEIVEEYAQRSPEVDSRVPDKNEADSRRNAGDGSPTAKHNAKKTYHSQKQSIIGRAEEVKSNWTEFNIEKEKSSSATGSKPISFSLNSKGKKAKKKKSKTAATKPSVASQDSTAKEEKPYTSTDIDNCQRPLWTAVIDTCCLLDDGGECVCELIELAKTAQFGGEIDGASLDEICVVIPHVLWSELDGITKRPKSRNFQSHSNSDDLERAEELSRKARGATRMLRDRMEMETVLYQTGRRVGSNRMPTMVHHRCILAQTVKEMKDACEKYLPPDDEHVNDDHILACALASTAKDASEDVAATAPNTAGGTVLLTNDQNLSCKAIANGIRVFSIEEFLRHISLRSEVRKDLLKRQQPPDYEGFTN